MDKIRQELHVHYQHDYELYGIQAVVPEYKLAWELNRALPVQLKKASDLPLEDRAESALFISNFVFSGTHRTFRLLKNQAFPATKPKAYLVPELSDWTYLLQVQDHSHSLDYDALHLAMNALSSIQQVSHIDLLTVAHKEPLLF